MLRIYPYPVRGAAGTITGGLQGRRGRAQNPTEPWFSGKGKGLTSVTVVSLSEFVVTTEATHFALLQGAADDHDA